eukprot:10085685-Alexandrium_andersonii.AAC.1
MITGTWPKGGHRRELQVSGRPLRLSAPGQQGRCVKHVFLDLLEGTKLAPTEDAELKRDRSHEGLDGGIELLEGAQDGPEGDSRHGSREMPT